MKQVILIICIVFTSSLCSYLKAEIYREVPPIMEDDDSIHSFSISQTDIINEVPTQVMYPDFNRFSEEAEEEIIAEDSEE